MAEAKVVSPADLLFDPENPRLSQPNIGQREAWRALATLLDRKLLKLAEDIVGFGLSPSDLPILMPSGDDTSRYIVLEGNRRLAALKSLENPEGIVGAVPQATLMEMRRLAREYQKAPIEEILCSVVKKRADADHWIKLRHSGWSEGAGVIPWGSDEASRYRARTGEIEPHTQALNFLEVRGDLALEMRRKIPATSFRRLIETPAVRAKIGIEIEKGELRLLADPAKVAKALLYIINDLVSGSTRVKDIYHQPQRAAYADKLPKEIVVKPVKGLDTPATPPAKPKPTQPKQLPKSKPRDILIPRECVLKITDARIRDIEDELRRLSLTGYPNAVSVLFRVFLELSADAHITGRKLSGITVDHSLSKKLLAVTADLIAQKKLTQHQATPVRRACERDSFLAPSVTLMHNFVHNPNVFPAGGDLRAYWNSLQPFVMAMWSP